MKKEVFVDIMESIKKQKDFDEQANKKFEEIFTDFAGWYNNDIVINGIELALEKEFNDKDEWIAYFIYELDYGKEWEKGCCKNEDGSDIDISTVEKLYDFLIKNYD